MFRDFVQLSWFMIVSCFLISYNYLGLSLLDVLWFRTIILVYHCYVSWFRTIILVYDCIFFDFVQLSWFIIVRCFVISYNYLGLSLLVVFWFRTIILVYYCYLFFDFVQLSWFIIVSCFVISYNYLGLSLLYVLWFRTIILVYHC